MAKRKKSATTEPAPPAQPTEGGNANGGGDNPKWQRMQPETPEETNPPTSDAGNAGEAPTPAPGTPTDPPPQPEPDKTLTQAEVDQLVAERLKRERKKYADYNDLKTKAKKFDEIEREQMGEVERLKLEAEEARQQAVQATQQAQQQQINNAILTAITEFQTDKNVTFRSDATQAALRLVELSDIEIDDGGNVSGVSEAVQALATDHPFLLQQPQATTPTSPTNPARTGPPQGATEAELRQKYFGGGRGGFFKKREEGVVYPE